MPAPSVLCLHSQAPLSMLESMQNLKIDQMFHSYFLKCKASNVFFIWGELKLYISRVPNISKD